MKLRQLCSYIQSGSAIKEITIDAVVKQSVKLSAIDNILSNGFDEADKAVIASSFIETLDGVQVLKYLNYTRSKII